MDSSEVLKAAIQPKGAKKISAEMGLSTSLIYKWCQPNETPDDSGADNPLDRLDCLMKLTNNRGIVEWICQRSGGFFVKNPDVKDGSEEELFNATQGIVKEFSELLAIVSKTYAVDDRITRKEAVDVRKEWEDLKAASESFVAACELGFYERKL